MSKRLILVLALAFVVGIAFAAYAEVQNVKVSGDIDMKAVSRNSLALQDNSTSSYPSFGESINAILSIVRLRVDADLTDNVATTVRLLNERVWGDTDIGTTYGTTQTDTNIELDLAYVTLKEFLYSPLTLTIGRQELRFGNALIIGDPDTNLVSAGHGTTTKSGLPDSLDDLSARKSFDAIKATLNYDPLVVDLVYAKIDENKVQKYDDVGLYGVNAGYAVNKDLNTEVYLWQRTRDREFTQVVDDIHKTENLRTVGARAMYTGIQNLMLGLETAFQFGDHVASTTLYIDEGSNTKANRKVTAYAIQAMVNRMFPTAKYTPSVLFVYTLQSGDKYRSISDNYTGWDAMFQDQGGNLMSKIAGPGNCHAFALSGSMKPTEDLTATLGYNYAMLIYPYTDLATAVTLTGVGGDPTYVMKSGKKDFGHEVDLGLKYDYTEDVQLALMTGAFIPGNAFDSKNKKTATQVIGSMKVTF